ncbi:expressed unknown protein [Seminavis robusta]|uniref:Uncharacterized protein n=1 Tax=Seminavis robusta TaxID=568900 RepID=A0A9N8DA35_9STRA|nr:expressed unknown protein [Seminavis robusta]|eukprot:Sro60_g034500.1 n/a (470) ;mRNA; f:12977-14386
MTKSNGSVNSSLWSCTSAPPKAVGATTCSTSAMTMTTLDECAAFLSETFPLAQWEWKKESEFYFGRVVDVLFRFPCLLREQFAYRVTTRSMDVYLLPLQLLLLSRTQISLPIVREIHALFPGSMAKMGRYYAEELDYSYYPLYLACATRNDTIIQFIASHLTEQDYDPRCLPMFRRLFQESNTQDKLSLKATQILLTKYPDLVTVEFSGGKILDLAFHTDYPLNVLQCILDKTPHQHRAIHIRAPSALSTDQVHNLKHHLLPCLHTLKWETNSSNTLLLLQDSLQENTSIQHLELVFRSNGNSSRPDPSFLTVLPFLLQADRLQSLRLETNMAPSASVKVAESLFASRGGAANHTLQRLHFLPPISELSTLKSLLETLEHGNTLLGLQEVSVDQSLRKYAAHKKLEYYLLLNQYGRATVRRDDADANTLMQLLDTVQNDTTCSTTLKKNRYKLLYGLLRESPTLWCAQL